MAEKSDNKKDQHIFRNKFKLIFVSVSRMKAESEYENTTIWIGFSSFFYCIDFIIKRATVIIMA